MRLDFIEEGRLLVTVPDAVLRAEEWVAAEQTQEHHDKGFEAGQPPRRALL
jgi:hypothetical protein